MQNASVRLRDRVLGCILGGALGDAWGRPYEGVPGPLQFAIPAHPMFSDDTQLTLATCESILECGRVDPGDLAHHFARWFQAGRIEGVGASTLKALRDLVAGTHWALAGARGEFAAGNGAAMRIAPLAFLLDPAQASDRTTIRDVCRITHHNDEAYVGALAIVAAVRSVLSGAWREGRSFLSVVVDGLPDSAVRDRIAKLLRRECPMSEIVSAFGATGHVVDTVPLALCCAQSIVSDTVPVVLAQTISVGGDTDTIASITGQLCGTVVGCASVLRDHLADIDGSEEVVAIGERFAEFVEAEFGWGRGAEEGH